VGLWFTFFNVSLQALTPEGEKPGTPQLLLAGASGGIGFWVAALPLDTVKSVMQVQADTDTDTDTALHIYIYSMWRS
jgi:hypothetical protein